MAPDRGPVPEHISQGSEMDYEEGEQGQAGDPADTTQQRQVWQPALSELKISPLKTNPSGEVLSQDVGRHYLGFHRGSQHTHEKKMLFCIQ